MQKIILIDTRSLDSSDISKLIGLIQKKKLEQILKKKKHQDRINSIVGISLAKILISKQVSISKELIQLHYTKCGKPFYSNSIHISVSHSGYYVSVAISTEQNIGIDIESTKNITKEKMRNFENMVFQNFPTNEQRIYKKTEPCQKRDMFLKLWVCNEAFLKWNGTGLLFGFKYFDIIENHNYLKIINPQLSEGINVRVFKLKSEHLVIAICQHTLHHYEHLIAQDGHEFLRERI